MHAKRVAILLYLTLYQPTVAFPQYEAMERSVELQERLTQAYRKKGISYRPRTEHFYQDGSPKYINRLILEDSPYLLQHAHNPVDWYPWSEEAFEQAKRENKPIFLSIGYSTCHWCHVMERESFEDPAIAAILNQHFIAVKVDRESHPDVDEVYMTAVTLLTGHGGWPMSSFLTPEGKPFYAGTYYPPAPFTGLLKQVITVWQEQHQDLLEQAQRVAVAVSENNRLRSGTKSFDPDIATRAVYALSQIYDEIQGGFSQAPKFPQEPWLFLLLDQAERHNDPEVLTMLTTTLDHMMHGGIYDQVGGGFHRYSTDYEWLVPHFEKMLYNQAHLSRIYLGAWRLTGRERYRRVAIQTLDYVLREMTATEGGFYSATDADSEGEEGRFYTWTLDEIRQALSAEDLKLAKSLYSISRIGNFEGRNILHLERTLEGYAKKHGMGLDNLRQRLDHINTILLNARRERVAPLRDDKLVTAWNGMMITAFAKAASEFDSARYRRAAEAAAEFLWQHNRRAPGQLWRVHLDGRSSVTATLEDYAYLAEGMLALYDLTAERRWLERSRELADALLTRFLDHEQGGFFLSEAAIGITAMERPKDDASDNAIPSGSSVALRTLQQLWRRTGNPLYRQQTDTLISRITPSLEQLPHRHGYLLTAILDLLQGEMGTRAYAAQGGIRLQADLLSQKDGTKQLQVTLQIPEGWHVNSDSPGNPDLIGTRLTLSSDSGWQLDSVNYPQGERLKLEFQEDPISLYTGDITIQARLQPAPRAGENLTLPVQVRLQACDEKVCLPPEQITFRIGLH
jgi:uncharacterized protein YyaL (SSP411 family)